MPLSKEAKNRIRQDANKFATNTSVCAGEFEPKVFGYTAGAEAEAERATGLIENYKKICEIAGVPQLLIDNPNLINGQLPTDEQVLKSWKTIQEWEKQAKNSK